MLGSQPMRYAVVVLALLAGTGMRAATVQVHVTPLQRHDVVFAFEVEGLSGDVDFGAMLRDSAACDWNPIADTIEAAPGNMRRVLGTCRALLTIENDRGEGIL